MRLKAVRLFLMSLSVLGCQTIPARPLAEASPVSNTFDAHGDYLIGRGDVIGVSLHGDEALSGTYIVADNGTASLPLVGFLPVEGITAKELRRRLELGFKPYVQMPKVAAWVADKKSFRAYFCGEVGRVGSITFSEPVSLLQGLAMAGGLTPYASKRIVVFRKNAKLGSLERFAVSYTNLLHGGKPYDSFRIDRGDTIVAE